MVLGAPESPMHQTAKTRDRRIRGHHGPARQQTGASDSSGSKPVVQTNLSVGEVRCQEECAHWRRDSDETQRVSFSRPRSWWSPDRGFSFSPQ